MLQPSRWPLILWKVTLRPLGQRFSDPPAETISTVPADGTPWRASFQPSRAPTASMAALGAELPVNEPRIATPVETLFQPPAWAPMTGMPIPPARPSKTRPKRSTRKL